MDSSPLGSSVHGISQARILEWVAISFRESPQSRDRICVSCVSWQMHVADTWHHWGHLGSAIGVNQIILDNRAI